MVSNSSFFSTAQMEFEDKLKNVILMGWEFLDEPIYARNACVIQHQMKQHRITRTQSYIVLRIFTFVPAALKITSCQQHDVTSYKQWWYRWREPLSHDTASFVGWIKHILFILQEQIDADKLQ